MRGGGTTATKWWWWWGWGGQHHHYQTIGASQLEGEAKRGHETQDLSPNTLRGLCFILSGGLSGRLTSEDSSAHTVAPPGSSMSCLVFFTALSLSGSRGGSNWMSSQFIAGPFGSICGFSALLNGTSAVLRRCSGIFPHCRNTFMFYLPRGSN